MPEGEQEMQSGPRPSRIAATLRALIRTRVTTGIITILPVLITLWVVRLIYIWMRDASRWVVEAFLLSPVGEPWLAWFEFDMNRWQQIQELGLADPHQQFFQLMPWKVQWGINLFSVLLTIFFLYAVGLFATNVVGKRAIAAMEQLVDRVPLIKTVYRGLKQILASLSSDQTETFRRAALIPFPQERMRCVGFVTNIFHDSITGEELCSVFIATTPNPTTGYLQVLRRKDITELNWSIEDAIRCVMSGGILKPEFLTIVPNKDLPDDVPAGIGPEPLPPPPEEPPLRNIDLPPTGGPHPTTDDK